MVDVTSKIVIDCSIDKVSRYSADPDNTPKWYVNIKAVDWKTTKPLCVGSKIAFVAYFLSRKIAYTYEVTEWEQNKKFVMRTADGPFPMETTYEWEAVNSNTTKMILRNRGTPSGFSMLVTPFMSFAMRRANAKDLRRLKSILEQTRSSVS